MKPRALLQRALTLLFCLTLARYKVQYVLFQLDLNFRFLYCHLVIDVVENFAFQDCKNLRKVLCLGNEIQFSHAVFKGCTRLETFDAVGTVDLGISVFENCENLRNFQGSINHIAHKTFKNCKKLGVTLIFADEVYRFHGGAFEGCNSVPCLVFKGIIQVADDITNDFMMQVPIMCHPECCIADLAYLGANVDTDCGEVIPF